MVAFEPFAGTFWIGHLACVHVTGGGGSVMVDDRYRDNKSPRYKRMPSSFVLELVAACMVRSCEVPGYSLHYRIGGVESCIGLSHIVLRSKAVIKTIPKPC